MDSHLSGINVTIYLKRPTLIQCEQHLRIARSLLGLAPGGVYLATDVAISAVRSYRTFSPLPINWRSIFCGTFRKLAFPRRYLAPCSREPGLSSVFYAATVWLALLISIPSFQSSCYLFVFYMDFF